MNFAWKLLGLLLAFTCLARGLDLSAWWGSGAAVALLLFGTALPMVLPPLAAASRRPPQRAANGRRVWLRTLCVWLGWTLVFAYAGLVSHWHPRAFGRFADLALLWLPVLFIATPLYLHWADRRSDEVEDDYWRLGRALVRETPFRWIEHRLLLLSWLIKAVFAPIMVGSLVDVGAELLTWQPRNLAGWIELLFIFGLAADLLFATLGYLMASKLLGNEVRSVDSSWSGWFACLICYPPFAMLKDPLTRQSDTLLWTDWLSTADWLYYPWAAVIVATWVTYWLSTAAFGQTFSNLCWRGLVNCGPYRYLKHPAYLSKNLYWWMSTVPFLGVHGVWDVVRNVAGMTVLSLIYVWRARTEERHLMKFPEYRAYAEHMAQVGWWARAKRWAQGALRPTRRAA